MVLQSLSYWDISKTAKQNRRKNKPFDWNSLEITVKRFNLLYPFLTESY